MKMRWLTAAAVVVVLTVPAAAAQEGRSEFESWRVPGWTFVPGLVIGAIYDNNIGLATPPTDTGRTDADETLLASPFGQLEYRDRRTEFRSGYSGSIRRYVDVEELNSFDHRLLASLRRAMTRRLSLHLQNSFTDVPTTDEVELNGVPFSRNGVQSNALSGAIEARLTRYSDLALRYENTWVDFDREETFLSAGRLNSMGAEWRRRLSERSALGAEYVISFADLNRGAQEMTFHNAGATFRHTLTQHTTMTLAGGASRVEGPVPGESHNGPYVRGSITHAGERTTVGASFERQFVPSFGFGGSNASQEVRGFVQMPITRNRFYVQGSAAWRRSDPLIEGALKLDTLWIRSSVGYAIAQWLRSEGFYSYTRQDSDFTGGEIDRHRIGVQFVVSKPMRIR
jgi:hypothetical protein